MSVFIDGQEPPLAFVARPGHRARVGHDGFHLSLIHICGRDRVTPLVEMLLRMRMEAKAAKDWATSDRIRDELTAIGIRVKDRKDGFDWEIE